MRGSAGPLPTPARFGSLEDARAFGAEFFTWYNSRHRHAGIGLLTPADVHAGRAAEITVARAVTLDAAYAAHPERFVRRPPTPPEVPTAVWINPPATRVGATSAICTPGCLTGLDRFRESVRLAGTEDVVPHAHRAILNLKACLPSTHRGVGADHLQVYLDEFVFRWNRRRSPMAGFLTLLGLGTGREPSTHPEILGPQPAAGTPRRPGRKTGITRVVPLLAG